MLWSKIIQITVLIVSIIATTVIYKKWPNIQQDNHIEESIEEYLEYYTGYDIDLSLMSAEEEYGN